MNVWKFMYGEDNYNQNIPFSYYKYMGSKTSPPCEENIIWFIYGETIKQGSTAISMIRDALNPPGKTPHDKMPNYDGSNRELQPIRKRKIYFYDRSKGCSPYSA
jgi:carbonic anhydrase